VGGSQVATAVVVHPATSALTGTVDAMSGFGQSVTLHRYDAGGKPVKLFHDGSVTANVPAVQTPSG
jgi:hypothetical protein